MGSIQDGSALQNNGAETERRKARIDGHPIVVKNTRPSPGSAAGSEPVGCYLRVYPAEIESIIDGSAS